MIQTQQGTVLGRFLGENVKGGSRDHARLDCVTKVLLVDDAATGTVNDKHPLFHFLEGVGTEQIAGFFGHGRVDGNIIGARKKLIQTHPLDPDLFNHLGTDVWVIRDDVHFQAFRPIGDDPSNSPHPDNSEHLVGDLAATKSGLLPFPRFNRTVGLGNIAT